MRDVTDQNTCIISYYFSRQKQPQCLLHKIFCFTWGCYIACQFCHYRYNTSSLANFQHNFLRLKEKLTKGQVSTSVIHTQKLWWKTQIQEIKNDKAGDKISPMTTVIAGLKINWEQSILTWYEDSPEILWSKSACTGRSLLSLNILWF